MSRKIKHGVFFSSSKQRTTSVGCTDLWFIWGSNPSLPHDEFQAQTDAARLRNPPWQSSLLFSAMESTPRAVEALQAKLKKSKKIRCKISMIMRECAPFYNNYIGQTHPCEALQKSVILERTKENRFIWTPRGRKTPNRECKCNQTLPVLYANMYLYLVLNTAVGIHRVL